MQNYYENAGYKVVTLSPVGTLESFATGVMDVIHRKKPSLQVSEIPYE
ncbi:MAG: hypothetical protein Q7S74_00465 [Nanoarchaeota archaeon]|nr:hypothetical protein [Nanoarchaeota archaeon]